MPQRTWTSRLVWTALATVLFSCANIVPPSGGQKDEEGPVLLGVVPYPGARNFDGTEVTFYFNEFLKAGNYNKEVFISPVPTTQPSIYVHNKRLVVAFKDALRENTTYVITLGKGIRDNTEGNALKDPVTYAFCTGDVLDTMSFKGNVINASTGRGEEEMTLLLFPEDEIKGDSILGIKPLYVVETDEYGKFDFRYLQKGRYKLYGVKDIDNNFMYNQPKEPLALAANPLIDLTDSAALGKPIELLSFVPDDAPMQVRAVRWANDFTLHVEFGEAVRDSFQGRRLALHMTDTSGRDSVAFAAMRFKDQDRSQLFIAAPRKRIKDYEVVLRNVLDSLGLAIDTTVLVKKDNLARDYRNRWFDAPIFRPELSGVILPAFFALPSRIEEKQLRIVDSLGKVLQTKTTVRGMEAFLAFKKLPDPSQPYFVEVKPGIALPDGKALDTTLRFPIRFPAPETFAGISGTIEGDSSKPGLSYVVVIKGKSVEAPAAQPAAGGGKGGSKTAEKPKVWTRVLYGPGPFSLEYVPAGTYEVIAIEDVNGDGALTPGSLQPYRLPERAITAIAPIEVKGNWDMKNYVIRCVPDSKYVKAGGKGKGKAKPGDPATDPNADPNALPEEPVFEDIPMDGGQ
jgi:Bacterial Ig-like domain